MKPHEVAVALGLDLDSTMLKNKAEFFPTPEHLAWGAFCNWTRQVGATTKILCFAISYAMKNRDDTVVLVTLPGPTPEHATEEFDPILARYTALLSDQAPSRIKVVTSAAELRKALAKPCSARVFYDNACFDLESPLRVEWLSEILSVHSAFRAT